MGEAKRKAAVFRSLGAMSLEEHVDDFRARVGSEFRRRGEVRHRLEALTDGGEVFEVDTAWRGDEERNIFYRALPGVLARRGVRRYLMAAETWTPPQGPDRTEGVLVLGVERDGASRYFHTEIKRGGERPALAEWTLREGKSGWMMELFDRADELPPETGLDKTAGDTVNSPVDPAVVDRMAVAEELENEIIETVERLYRPGEDWSVLGGLMATIAYMFSQPSFNAGLRGYAQRLRDNPDICPIAPIRVVKRIGVSLADEKHLWRYHDPIVDILRGHDEEIVFNAVVNVMISIGIPLMGGPGLANWLGGLAWPVGAHVFGFLNAGMKIRIHHDGSEHGIREESDELLVRLIREGCTQRVIRDASDDELLAAIRDWRVKSQVGVERAEQFRPEQGGS